jgi:hypothetical protein
MEWKTLQYLNQYVYERKYSKLWKLSLVFTWWPKVFIDIGHAHLEMSIVSQLIKTLVLIIGCSAFIVIGEKVGGCQQLVS